MDKKIHLIYFSGRKHFKYLFLSLKSLLKFESNLIGNIYLYINEDDFLSQDQINKLKEIHKLFIIRKTKKITGVGKESILSELKAFEEVSGEIDENDYIAKVDSDIIFLNGKIFRTVVDSNKILIGFKEVEYASYNNFVFTQGGLYFVKSGFIPEILDSDLEEIFKKIFDNLRHSDGCPVIRGKEFPEDVVIYTIISQKTGEILFVPFMNIFKFYKQTDPSVIHFMKTKGAMKFYYYVGNIGLFIYSPYYYIREIINIIKKLIITLVNFLKNFKYVYKLCKKS